MEGLVIKTTGSWYIVLYLDDKIIQCKLKGNFKMKGMKTTNPIAVGDKVTFHLMADETMGLITDIKERFNCIIRKSTNLSKQRHILAANIDKAFLIVTIASPRTSTGFIDRFLITAEAYHIPAVIVFNKIDIYDDKMWEYHNELKSIYEKVGYPCMEVSALSGENIKELRDIITDKVSLFSGHSGVGKSELINKIAPELNLKTGIISDYHQKGKHTTTFAEMFRLPFGGFIIDTPGIKEFGMVNFSKDEVTHWFPEMKLLANKCQFNNCTHEHERVCAVKDAVNSGEISEIRYYNYLNIINGREMEIEDWELK
ncbi:MAG: ribosome small subunit-dependent GTPase A [Bacteroidota bacterium]